VNIGASTSLQLIRARAWLYSLSPIVRTQANRRASYDDMGQPRTGSMWAFSLLLIASCSESPAAPTSASDRTNQPAKSSAQSVRSDLWDALPQGWSKLAPPPVATARAASAWTGNELVYWGGDSNFGGTSHAEGAAFDPLSNEWRKLPPAPISARTSPGAVWTGTEMLVWGGSGGALLADGAAYSPAHHSWRKLARAPLDPRDPVAAVWNGSEMIVWGSTSRPRGSTEGAAYDPAVDRWREIAKAPLSLNLASAVWTGSEMIVYGALLDNNNASHTDQAQGIAYHPATDSWRVLPAYLLSPQASSAVWTGEEMIVWDYGLSAGAYDPALDRWRALPDVPLDDSECYPNSAFSEYLVIGQFCFENGVRFDVELDQWERFDWADGIVAGRPVAADGVFLFAGATHESTHNALWVYKPERDPGWPDCGVIDPASDAYGISIEPDHGLPGTTVSLSGTTLRGEDGRWAPADRLEAWWNTSIPEGGAKDGRPVKDGPSLRLVEVSDMERCSFETKFTIPDVEPGSYLISVFAWDVPPSDGYGSFLPHRFMVTKN
jgi:hypothetical protein